VRRAVCCVLRNVSPSTQMSNLLEAESIIQDIERLAREVQHELMGREQFHSILKRKVARLARKFGLGRCSEYPVTRSDGKLGLIDVVWLSASRPVAAFEIDSSLRRKSIDKLLALEVPFRFWVYYGAKNAVSLIREADPDGLIRLIKLQGVRLEG
jgi:hypothetical protein